MREDSGYAKNDLLLLLFVIGVIGTVGVIGVGLVYVCGQFTFSQDLKVRSWF